MTLDEIIEELSLGTNKRFISREEKYAGLRESATRLFAYAGQPLKTTQIHELDSLALFFKRQQREELSDIIQHIDEVRAPYRPQKPLLAYDIISTNAASYNNRIQEIHHIIDTQTLCYDDLALTKDWLETNSYVRRKRKNNTVFNDTATTLIDRINSQITSYDATPTQNSSPSTVLDSTKRFASRVAVGVSAALLALSAVPTAWYAPLYQ